MVLGAITGVPTPACLSAASNPVEAVTPPRLVGLASTVRWALSKNFFQYTTLATINFADRALLVATQQNSSFEAFKPLPRRIHWLCIPPQTYRSTLV
jgi:hypothetical protein